MRRMLVGVAGFWLLSSGLLLLLHGDVTAGRLIAYSAEINGNRDIYLKTPDGQYVRRMTTSPDAEWSPVWSPDGRWIAFAANGGIHVMRPDGKKTRRIGRAGVFIHNLSWSPDSQWVSVFTAGQGSGVNRRYMTHIHTGETIGLDNVGAYAPVWSSQDGWMLVNLFQRSPATVFGDTLGLIRVRPDGTDYAFLSTYYGNLLALSPDEQWVAFSYFQGEKTLLYRMFVQGGEPELLTDQAGSHSHPRWSPDSQKIAFLADNTLYLVHADSGHLTKLIHSQALSPFYLDWSPDGEWLVFTLFNRVYKIRADGSGLQALSPGCGLDPDWLPEGDYIVFRCRYDVFWIRPDGSRFQHLGSENYFYVDRLSWSPIFDP